MNTDTIQDEALHFIQQLDAAAFEAYLQGDCTGERYREIAGHIATVQRLTVGILYGVNAAQYTARE